MTEAHAVNYLDHLEAGNTRGFSAQAAGLSRFQICRYRASHEWFRQAEAEIMEVTTEAVEDALYVNALGGNVAAQIFWLKNRAPDAWRDLAEVSIEHEAPQAFTDLVRNYREEEYDEERDGPYPGDDDGGK